MLNGQSQSSDPPQKHPAPDTDLEGGKDIRQPNDNDVDIRMRRITTAWDKCLARKEEIDARELWKEIADIRFAAVKVGNIPWEISSSEIVETFSRLIPLKKLHIHIPIDRATGKTKPEMFIEMPTIRDALHFASYYNRSILRGRAISVTSVSLDEVVLAHFPVLADGSRDFLSQDEVASLVNICRNYKAHFSRKCAERPFEHVLSILRLAPWYLMSDRMCNRTFFMASGASEALLDHLARHQSHHPQVSQLQVRQQLSTHLYNRNIFTGPGATGFSLLNMVDFDVLSGPPAPETSQFVHPLDPTMTATNQQHLATSTPSATSQVLPTWAPSSWAAAVAAPVAPSANVNAPCSGGVASHLGKDLLGRLVGASQTFPAFSAPQRMALKRMVAEQPSQQPIELQRRESKPRFGTPILLQIEAKGMTNVCASHNASSPASSTASLSSTFSSPPAFLTKEGRPAHAQHRPRRPSLDAILKEHHNDKKGERSASVSQMMRDVFDKIMLSTDD